MKSIKKSILFVLLFLLICAVVSCLCACNTKDDNSGNNQGDDNEIQTSTPDNKIPETHNHMHILSLVPANSADCVNTGSSAYYTCTCGKWFSDSNAKNEITDKSSVVIGTLLHKYSSEWSQSNTQHWHECSVCGNKKDLVNHTAGTAATETTAQVCTVCDYVLTAPLGHTHKPEFVPAKAADCEIDGNIEYYTCTCGKWFSDSNAINEITDKSSVVLTATGHSYSSEWSYNSTQHWYSATCKHTDEKDSLQNHDFQDGICSVCKYSVGLLTFKTLQLGENDTAYVKVSNDTTSFSFLKEVTANNGATYTVCTDMACTQTVPSKTVALQVGDNTFYILSERGNDLTLFIVTIRRRPIHTVTFLTSGMAVSSQSVEEDSFAVQPDETTKIGYTFNNWTYGGEVVSFPYTITKNITFTAEFTANEYTAALDVNGGNTLEKSEFSATYDKSFSFVTPTRTGYTFLGWYDSETKVTDKKWNYAEDKTFTAKWEAKPYNVSVSYDNYSHGSVSGSGTYDCDSSVTVTATTKAGYTFTGWYNGENLLDGNLSYTFTMPAEDITYTAKWCKVSTASDNTTAGTVSSLNGTYISGEEVKIVATSNARYTFIGWYIGDTLFSNDLTCIVIMPSVDTVFTAKWTLDEKLNSFYYTSTETTVTITGIIDKTITDILIPDYVTSISGSAFSGCSKLITITLPFIGANKDGTENTHFGYIFGAGNYEDNSMYVPASLKMVVITGSSPISEFAFYNCAKLVRVIIGDGVPSIGGYAFYGCSALSTVIVGNGVTSIGKSAFEGCYNSLYSITLPFVGANKDGTGSTYFGYIFGAGNYEDNSMYVPLTLRKIIITGGRSIGNNAFYYCHSIYSITLHKRIISIGSCAFEGCSRMVDLIIPDSVNSIGKDAFKSCTALTNVYYTGAEEAWDKISGGYENIFLTYAILYFYSETEPALSESGMSYDGNYWHYDSDGKNVIWKKEN